MVSDLIFSYSGCFFIILLPAFDFCNLSNVARALTGEYLSKNSLSTTGFSISQVTFSFASFMRGATFSVAFVPPRVQYISLLCSASGLQLRESRKDRLAGRIGCRNSRASLFASALELKCSNTIAH